MALLKGPDPVMARPVLATEDPRVVRAVLKALKTRLTGARRALSDETAER